MAHIKQKRRNKELFINRSWCKGCGVCIAFCPKEAIYMDDSGKAKTDQEKCTVCGICETFCPDFAISLVEGGLSK
ncbi:MAG: indolepyruvate ferredoxin oxidoreductase subunit alpha [Bacillota bacterium]